MQTQAKNRPIEEIVAAIRALDLDPIKLKLMDREEGQGWSREYVDKMETAYKRFLTLLVKYPEETIAPSKDVDKFWHGHILDTMKYADDCDRVFGYFLHHFPYFGMRGEEDAANLAQAGEAMSRLYEKEFGEGLPVRSAYCGTHSAAYCGASAKTEAAYCGAAGNPAYCGSAVKQKEDAAYCGAASESAYCGSAVAQKDAAYCGAAGKPAYCGSAVKQKEDAAYCGTAGKPAYCGTKQPATNADKLKAHLRPTLAATS